MEEIHLSYIQRFISNRLRYILVAALVAFAGVQLNAQQLTFPNYSALTDNVTNQGSPFLLSTGPQGVDFFLYYVRHGSAPNDIMYDLNGGGAPIDTGIASYVGQLGNVSGAILNGQIMISYVNSAQQVEFAISNDGYSGWTYILPSSSELGTGTAGLATWCPPTLVTDPTSGTVYIATVGTDGHVYISSTTDGKTFTPVSGNGVSVSSFQTLSQPALTMWGTTPWVAFTNLSRDAVVGNALTTNAGLAGGGYAFGNNNANGRYAGLSMTVLNGYLYVFGQSTASSQYLIQIFTSDGTTWGSFQNQIQERWSPSVITVGPQVYLAIQDDNNTNITTFSTAP
jgi:hypothetical protein